MVKLPPTSSGPTGPSEPASRPTVLGQVELTRIFIALRPAIARAIQARVGNAAVAADLVQDLFLRLERIGEQLPSEGEAQRYLMRMAINASIDHQRVESRRIELLQGFAELFEPSTRGPEDEVLAADQLRAVDAALAELPPKCREMLFLSRVEGLTHREIADQMGVSRSLVEKYLLKALLHCKVRLAGDA